MQGLLGFHPGVTGTVEINQDVQPPNNRTTFDPDSITAALAVSTPQGLQKAQSTVSMVCSSTRRCQAESSTGLNSIKQYHRPFQHVKLGFSSISFLPNTPLYGTIYPDLALEVGRNLNKPSMIAMTAVDLRNYNDIFRGVIGSDAVLAVASWADRSADVFSISGTYRLRLPAFDEPFVETRHQVTTVSLTTKARNWVQANVNYAPWKFKYLSLNAKYEYGDPLPPLRLP